MWSHLLIKRQKNPLPNLSITSLNPTRFLRRPVADDLLWIVCYVFAQAVLDDQTLVSGLF